MYFFRNDLKEKHQVDVNVPHLKYMMCLNESDLDPWLAVKQEFLDLMEKVHLNRYYSDITQELHHELAEYARTGMDQIIMGNGADEMLYYLFTSVRDNLNSFALSLSPSYFDYQSYCDAVGLKLKKLPLSKEFGFDPERFIELADDPECKLLIICNPNNPTGNLFPEQDIIKIIEQNPQRLVLIDETYFEFSGITFVPLISKFPNLVIIRTFSKAFSAAGLRFGYMISSAENIHQIKKVVTAFNLSIFTQAFTLTVIRNKDIFLEHDQQVIRQREILYRELGRIRGIEVFKSFTNFLLFRHKDYIDLFNYLKENEIAVRNVADKGILDKCLRVSVSTEKLNQKFIKVLNEFVK